MKLFGHGFINLKDDFTLVEVLPIRKLLNFSVKFIIISAIKNNVMRFSNSKYPMFIFSAICLK